MPASSMQQDRVNQIVKKVSGSTVGNKLKSLRPARNIRPGKESKGEITRGGGYAAT